MTLTEFLLARIADDEAVAREAINPESLYLWGDRSLPPIPVERWPDDVRGYLGGSWGEHCARHDPTRVLAECAAKRAIVAELTGGPVHTNPAGVMTRILRALAAVYADHPDYPDHKGE